MNVAIWGLPEGVRGPIQESDPLPWLMMSDS